VFTTRLGGVSQGPYESLNLGILTDDDQACVAENRGRAAARVGVAPEDVGMGWQVHGTDLLEWTEPPRAGGYAEPGAELQKVDGHGTELTGVALLVLVADCLPVALAAPGRVAMVHCGWRGLAAGIAERAVATFDVPPVAAIGPGIGRCCYEVGPEVLEAFDDLEGVADGRMLDLRAVAEARLRAAGVESIEHVDLCTSCHPDLFFSHRRDDGVTGRQSGMVVRS
jgi:purine-nucleoside/S-methyl-5'-thioadenosine phosphorylase / adenosine deaminase